MAAGTRGAVSLFPYGFCVISLAFETKAFPGALCVPLVLKLKAAPGARSFGSSPGAPQMALELNFGGTCCSVGRSTSKSWAWPA